MITKLYLENFRAFKRATVDMSKINLFFGPNNSGKSALISAINLVAQTIKSADIDADILLTGQFEDFGSYYDIVFNNDVSNNIKIRIEAEIIVPTRYFVTSKRGGRLLRFGEEKQRGYIEITLGYRKYRHEVQLINSELGMYEEDGSLIALKTRRNKLGKHVIEDIQGLGEIEASRINQMVDVRNILPEVYPIRVMSVRDEYYLKLRKMQNFSRAFREQLNKVEFIGPFRTNPQRFYILTGESPSNVGRHGERAFEILMQAGYGFAGY